ncbi:MAG TPA: hypothetical protein GXX17_00125 [Clostridiales bacterium]|nr:hypothetical protein [Clostridiales bacterium]
MLDKYNMTADENLFLAKKLLEQNIYACVRLEGFDVTFPEVKTILDGVNVGSVDLCAVELILNLRAAWRFVFESFSVSLDFGYVCMVNEFLSPNARLLRAVRACVQQEATPQYDRIKRDIEGILAKGTAAERATKLLLYGLRRKIFLEANTSTFFICANKILISEGAGVFAVNEVALLKFLNLIKDVPYNTEDIKNLLYECITGIDWDEKRNG